MTNGLEHHRVDGRSLNIRDDSILKHEAHRRLRPRTTAPSDPARQYARPSFVRVSTP
jgi:hypothetical protein